MKYPRRPRINVSPAIRRKKTIRFLVISDLSCCYNTDKSLLKRMIVTKRYTFREKFSWSLYDWANSVFATTVLAGFFPLFFKSYWAGDLDDATSTALLGTASSVAGLIIVFAAPLLGAMADLSRKKKLFLSIFALLGIISTSILFFYFLWILVVEFNDFWLIGYWFFWSKYFL